MIRPATADIIVIGLGAVGSAALYQIARRGVRAIGIDRFTPPHDRGSSHGESRITRQAIGEGEEYVPLALRSHEIWRELESETGRSMLSPVGGLIIGRPTSTLFHGRADFISRTISAARRFSIAHEVLTAADTMKRFPQFRLAGDETCYFEPGAGFLRPEVCIQAQLQRAQSLGADVRTGEVVTGLSATSTGVTVTTNAATYSGHQAIVAAGAWLPGVLGGDFQKTLRVYRQTLLWFDPDTPGAFAPDRFPIFIWRHGDGDDEHFYGVPVVSHGVKLATEQFDGTVGPDDPRPATKPAEAADVYETHIRPRINGMSPRCLQARTCLYTVSPDFGFVIDRHPEWDRVLVASPCSGHGFKHSAAVGESLAQWAIDGASRVDLSPFAYRWRAK